MTKGFWFVAIAIAIVTEVEPATNSDSDSGCGSGGDSDSGGGGGDQSGECNDSLCLGWTEERCGKTSSAVLSLHKSSPGIEKKKKKELTSRVFVCYRKVYNLTELASSERIEPDDALIIGLCQRGSDWLGAPW